MNSFCSKQEYISIRLTHPLPPILFISSTGTWEHLKVDLSQIIQLTQRFC